MKFKLSFLLILPVISGHLSGQTAPETKDEGSKASTVSEYLTSKYKWENPIKATASMEEDSNHSSLKTRARKPADFTTQLLTLKKSPPLILKTIKIPFLMMNSDWIP